jgi:hypothetical protein
MSVQGAQAAFVLSSILVLACSAKTLDFSRPDGGAEPTSGAGGTTGGTGTGGGAGNPNDGGLSDPFVTKVPPAPKISKIDLLFMIDNSSSMVDKQVLVSEAVPELVNWIVDPKCIDPITVRTVGNAQNGMCPPGSVRAFEPILDIHIGIISSSLGSHGAAGVCDDNIDISQGRSDPHNDDRAHLLTRGVGGNRVATFENKGFLYFNPAVPGALTGAVALSLPFTDLVRGVGQHGCGYEASLEAVYRFLVDPEPYDTIVVDSSIELPRAVLAGIDSTLLRQRADFLRPDSLVSVMLVTDENDCSVIDGGDGFFPLLPPGVVQTGKTFLKHGTSKCLENPNDRCCFNCGRETPAGCPPTESDPECLKGELSVEEDTVKLRCFNQKQRYGVDFLYPVQRYIDGFTKPQVPNRRQELVPNPLFADLGCTPGTACVPPRDRGLVLVTGIVGVPWQDIAVDPNDLTNGYKTAQELRDQNVWANIVGDPLNATGPVPPRDPHMIESIRPRAGLAGPGGSWRADPIHGHEWDTSQIPGRPNSELQYACIFDLVTPRICTEPEDCDCFGPNLEQMMNPLCQNAQGVYTTQQLRGKAYPGTRILQVLQGIGEQAIVGSICPANVRDKNRDDYGFSPTVRAIGSKLRRPVREQCSPVALPVDATNGQARCRMIEVFDAELCKCDGQPGRSLAPSELLTDEMKAQGTCRCEMMQLSGDAQSSCQTQLNPPTGDHFGWCYVDPAQQSSHSCDLVRACPVDQQRRIRFNHMISEPRPGATVYVNCQQPAAAPSPFRCP